MVHYLIELAVWLLIAFFIGCLLGWFLRNLFGGREARPETEPVRQTWQEREPAVTPAAPPVAAAPIIEPEPAVEPVVVAEAEPAVVPAKVAEPEIVAPAAAAEPEISGVSEPAAAAAAPAAAIPLAGRMERPKGLGEARGGQPDNLQRISGIGPKNEKILHNLGVFHFDQIAAWTIEQVSWVDDHLKFNGRIGREQWIEQASLLAAGKEEEFRTLFGTGGLKNRSGVSESGSRTRRS